MTTKEQLIEQHIREYESRLKHIDELYARAHEATEHLDDDHSARAELQDIAERRGELKQKTEALKSLPASNWREETMRAAGPMAIWDIVAQKLEDFVERHE